MFIFSFVGNSDSKFTFNNKKYEHQRLKWLSYITKTSSNNILDG